ncbi:EF-P beta-lysylation protein EpmB [Ferrimonas marina]|uniref:L-lysine 2,3-aminomutase n=1 Tax=Ferrimonas marina TaxID=299255 RepID=A0A1M5XAC3_9GAMM|nr:EF-P beta-lysylation protein EpmB [Ferrimonas marina]SHH96815.1 EF-P beta-lysylation protein EpmB [Ferrimonas marina]
MITRNPAPLHRPQASWQQDLASAFSDPVALLTHLRIDPAQFGEGLAARRLFPMRVPRPYANRITPGDAQDPLLLQVLPLGAEFLAQPGFGVDPTGEQGGDTPGLLHKYRSRVLLMLRGGCAINCRYCFRRHFPYQDHKVGRAELEQAVAYLNADPQINELLLSGGDPLMAKDDHLAQLFERLTQAKHLKRVRFHTRLPVVIPNRVTDALVTLLEQAPWPVVMVLHINHPREIDDEVVAAMQRLRAAGVTLLNQGVLLKGVNDDAQVLAQLSERLFEAGILPYYLHQLDKVQGAGHFEVSDEQARALMAQLLATLPGFLVPRLVRELPGHSAKTPIDLRLEPA